MEQSQAVTASVPGSMSCMALGSRVRAEPFTKKVLRLKKKYIYTCVCVCVCEFLGKILSSFRIAFESQRREPC